MIADATTWPDVAKYAIETFGFVLIMAIIFWPSRQ